MLSIIQRTKVESQPDSVILAGPTERSLSGCAATWIPGTLSHSWQAVACGGTDIGAKGMIVAVKSMAFTGINLFKNTGIIKKAREEWLKEKGGTHYKYETLLGDRKPAMIYRN